MLFIFQYFISILKFRMNDVRKEDNKLSIFENTQKKKEELIKKIEKELYSTDYLGRSISVRKKIVTYENLLRFYQNSIVTFALEDHRHYTQDIETDEEHRFVNDSQIEAINRYMQTTTATKEQIELLFN